MIKHINISIEGKVYKTGFRFHTMMKASEMNIRGFVKYKHKNEVYIEAEGEEDQLLKIVEWCHKGPIGARVSKVSVEEGTLNEYKTFVML